VSNVYESRLVIGSDVSKSAVPMGQTPATKDREPVHGNIVLVDNSGCSDDDFSDKVKGNIALIKRGDCPFGQKSMGAGRAGAKAAIIYNTEDDELNGSLEEPQPDHVATFGIKRSEGEAIVKKLQAGKVVDAIAYIDATIERITTQNVLAETTHGDADNCVMLGGHSDSVSEGPGINDDGSGSISVLEIAAQLAKFRVNNCVRFAWWSAEEEGLLGSNAYAKSLSKKENKRVRLFMDLDMMASPNYAYQIYNATNVENPTGSEELRNLYMDWYKSQGLNYTFVPFDGRSDYVGFIENGIPAGGFATGAEKLKTEEEVEMFGGKAGIAYDPNYHQLGDDLTNVDAEAWVVNTKVIATFAVFFFWRVLNRR
jgi:aminopeptidase Y